MALLLAVAASYGAFLLYTSIAYGWSGLGVGPPSTTGAQRRRPDVAVWMTQAGLGGVQPAEFTAVMIVFAIVGAGIAFALFGGLLPSLVAAAFAASFPVASYRARRDRRRGEAREAWPRMIEEMRLLTGSLGRSVPQALFDVGRRGPEELRPAFAAAHREWMISTDFARSVAVLKHGLADPTADATCETLLVAHEVGGNDLDRRLAALVEDRVEGLQGRKDAKAKQAGVRFARRFVLLVPLGMALAGLSIGNGRAAYATATGQLGVAFGLGMIACCWIWAGRLLKLPDEQRVFDGGGPAS
ncbi:MAG: type II secretion system F family protein [Acidimicrobiales bacterium]